MKTGLITAAVLSLCLTLPAAAQAADPEELTLEDLLTTRSTSLSVPHLPFKILYQKPSALHESVIASDQLLAVSYSGVGNRLQINITLNTNPSLTSLLSSFADFRNYVLQPFGDKEKLLYGEYEIVEENDSPGSFVLTTDGYLKKPDDGILPAMYNLIYQSTRFDGQAVLSAQCQIQGAPEQQLESRALYKELRPLCEEVVKSVRLENKSK